MKSLLLLCLISSASSLLAQEAEHVDAFAALPAQSDEKMILSALRAVVLLPTAMTADSTATVADGLDATAVPLLDTEACRRELQPFLGRPVSRESLERLQQVIRTHLQFIGRPLARVYAPPQDITDGTVRIVVQLASLEGEVRVDGNTWFARERYTDALRVRSGETVDATALNVDLAWLNRNPFTRVTPLVEAGEQPGTTRLALRVQERRPWQLSAGYDNTGTKTTGEDRVSAGVLWGNALGLGHQANYRFTSDPKLKHSRSHSLSYAADLPWRHSMSVFAAWSELKSIMPEPFTQEGNSGQAGVRYVIPLASRRGGWTQSVTFGGDFKYSDNTLEFATLPVTDNVTHIVQGSVAYALNVAGEGQQAGVSATVFASPGGLSGRNRGRHFDASRAGAKAEYVYGRIDAQYSRTLPGRFWWNSTASLQIASGALLGSEQLNGGGAYAVRGYRESSAFGDGGLVVNNELHAPGFALFKGEDQLDFFAFADFAALNLEVDRQSTDLRSAGIGVNYQWRRHVSVRAAYGWQLKRLDFSNDRGHGHISANVRW